MRTRTCIFNGKWNILIFERDKSRLRSIEQQKYFQKWGRDQAPHTHVNERRHLVGNDFPLHKWPLQATTRMPPQSASQASTSPEKSHTEDRKRKRDVLSCLDCRRRKLKRDRGFPACGRCVKGGITASCAYKSFNGGNEGYRDELDASAKENGRVHKRACGRFGARLASEEASIGTELVPGNYIPSASTISSQASVIKLLENRLATLESMLIKNSNVGNFPLQGPHSATIVSNLGPRGIRAPETHLFKGRGVRTQFYGLAIPPACSLMCVTRQARLYFVANLLTNHSSPRSVPS
jgi:hypothetical protein